MEIVGEKENAETEKDDESKKKDEQKKDELSDKNKALLTWSEKEWEGNGFIDWEEYEHPELGKVEIGGFVPYLETTPKAERIDSLLDVQLPWLLQLTKKMPEISLADQKVTPLGAGVYKLELFIENIKEVKRIHANQAEQVSVGPRAGSPAPNPICQQ